MKHSFSILGLLYFLILFGCKNKEVELPLINIDGISEIQNHSSIWVFYEQTPKDTLAILNNNNKLLNTNWIYNIDSRLTMDKVVPILIKMQENRNKKSMHKKEGMLNFFSYANTKDKNISLVMFDTINFKHINHNGKNGKPRKVDEKTIQLKIKNNNIIIDKRITNSSSFIADIKTLIDKDTLSNLKIVLYYPDNLTFQNYLSIKAHLASTNIDVDRNEYIYSIK